MIILLYGPDSYRSSQKLKEIVANYKAKHKSGLNFSQIEWAQEAISGVKDSLSSYSMFGEKKLIVIKNACAAKIDEQENLLALLKEKNAAKDEENILVFLERDEPKKGELFNWLKKQARMSENFESLSGLKLNNWVKKEIQNLAGQISASAVDRLVGFVGSDLWQLHNEIEKLVDFK